MQQAPIGDEVVDDPPVAASTGYDAYEPPTRVAPEVAPPPAPTAPTAPRPDPPAWLLWPARAIALGIVLPVRLAWELLCAAGRTLRRAWTAAVGLLGRALLAVLRPVGLLVLVPVTLLGRWLFCPLTSLLGRGLAIVWTYVVWPSLAFLAAGVAVLASAAWAVLRVARDVLRRCVAALARGTRALFAGLGWLCRVLLLQPAAALLHLLVRGASALVRYARWLLGAIGRVLAVPLLLAWRWVLRPVLIGVGLALAAVALGVWRFLLHPILRGVDAVLRGIGATVRAVGRVLRAAVRTVGAAFGWAWRTAGTILAAVGRVLAIPFIWLYRQVLTPIGHAIRTVWRACVIRPARAVRKHVDAITASVRTAWTQVRQQLSILLGRAR